MQVELRFTRLETETTNSCRKFNTMKAAREFLKKHDSEIVSAKLYAYDGHGWSVNKVLK